MDASDLRRLYDRLIVQAEYPGGTCPTEPKLAGYVEGSLWPVERQRLEAHLNGCPSCREALRDLAAAGAAFAGREAALKAGLLARAVHPLRAVLQHYAAGAVAETAEGRRLKADLAQHLEVCPDCRHAVERLQAEAAALLAENLAGLRRPAEAAREALLGMFVALKAVAASRPAERLMLARAGFRRAERPLLHAVATDRAGRLVADPEGQPRTIAFAVVRAELGYDGHLVVDLSTTDRSVWPTDGRAFEVALAIQHENRRLILPNARIYAQGRATIAGDVVAGVELREIPLTAITLAVVPVEGQDW